MYYVGRHRFFVLLVSQSLAVPMTIDGLILTRASRQAMTRQVAGLPHPGFALKYNRVTAQAIIACRSTEAANQCSVTRQV